MFYAYRVCAAGRVCYRKGREVTITIQKDSPAWNALHAAVSGRAADDFTHTLRIATGDPGTVSIKVNEGMWTPPLSTEVAR